MLADDSTLAGAAPGMKSMWFHRFTHPDLCSPCAGTRLGERLHEDGEGVAFKVLRCHRHSVAPSRRGEQEGRFATGAPLDVGRDPCFFFVLFFTVLHKFAPLKFKIFDRGCGLMQHAPGAACLVLQE